MKKWLKITLVQLGGWLGYCVLPSWRLERLQQARHLRRLFDHIGVDCVIDIGANEGQYCTFLRNEAGYRGRIICFEPIPEVATRLKQRMEYDSGVVVHNVALGPTDGVVRLNLAAYSVFSSVLNPLTDEVSRFDGANTVVRTADCPMRSVSSVLTEVQQEIQPHSLFMKLDTQGFDLDILKGAGITLKTVSAIQTEASFHPIYAEMPDYHATISYLKGQGFVLSSIYPAEGGRFPILIEADCIFVHTDTREVGTAKAANASLH